MRGFSRLLAFLFLALLIATGVVFYYQRLAAEANATPAPPPLPGNIAGTADRWQWSHTVGGKPIVEVSAREYRMIQSPSRVELTDVELRIFGGDRGSYDLVRSRRADVDTRAKTMYSEGEVEITMQVPADGSPLPERPLVIRSSKVYFETETGIARTAERAYFQFADGFGEAVGAVYNPQTKEIVLEQEADFTFQKQDGEGQASRVKAAHAVYREALGVLDLSGPTRLERENLQMDAGDATILLNAGNIQRVDAVDVDGSDEYPGRKLAFGGDRMEMHYREDGTLRELLSHSGSRLDSTSAISRNQVRSTSMHLLFREGVQESTLEKAFARGKARLDSTPVGTAATRQSRRVMESEEIELRMQASGEEVERLLTHAPGTLTFYPASAEQRQRVLRADRMTAEYGEQNRLRHFRSVQAVTESLPSEAAVANAKKQKLPEPGTLKTRSNDLEAEFHPETGEMVWMKQWGGFQFEEGVRRGRADLGMLHQAEKYNLLEGNARVWDTSGTLQAARIRTQEPSGDMVAEGNVISTQQPSSDTKPKPQPAGSATGKREEPASKGGPTLPGGEQAMLATANKMTTRDQNQWIRYEGNARLWQGANRLHADVATIDRAKQTLEGQGTVFSQIEEAQKAAPGSSPAPVFTLIHSDRMIYLEEQKLATYTGKVRMRRQGLSVDSEKLRMFLEESETGETQLKQSFADGDVRIVMREPETTRRGGATHAEYYPEETKTVLYGGEPFFDDEKQGATRGKRLTYFSNDDRLIVESGESAPALSVIRRN